MKNQTHAGDHIFSQTVEGICDTADTLLSTQVMIMTPGALPGQWTHWPDISRPV